jgi:hypothetical protein
MTRSRMISRSAGLGLALAWIPVALAQAPGQLAQSSLSSPSSETSESSQAPAFAELMRALGGVAERHARFEETRRMALLTTPLVRRGLLDYVRPDRLDMRVETPYFEHLQVAGDALTIERRGGTTRLSLASQPVLAAWIECMRATLAGDGAALAGHFDVRLDGSIAQWRLELTPRDAQLRSLVLRVGVSGRGATPERFEVDEARGDSSTIVITPRSGP